MFFYYLKRITFVACGAAILVLVMTHPFFLPNLYTSAFKRFELVDPETAPAAIKDLVMEGYRLMNDTHKHAPDYAEDWISCSNCHFSGGNTLGGTNGGISLVGVTTHYPRITPGKPDYTLADRINGCFERSLNGKPLPKEGRQMEALVAYLDWISTDAVRLKSIPWLGLKPLRSHHKPDPQKGAQVYATNCAMCHGHDGGGQKHEFDLSYPPLWGAHAFNTSAGLNQLDMLSSFVYHNMPYQDPQLSIEEALDVAAFIIQQPKPIEK